MAEIEIDPKKAQTWSKPKRAKGCESCEREWSNGKKLALCKICGVCESCHDRRNEMVT